MSKKWLFIGIITVLSVMLLTACKIQSVEEFHKEEQASQASSSGTNKGYTNTQTPTSKIEKAKTETKTKTKAKAKKDIAAKKDDSKGNQEHKTTKSDKISNDKTAKSKEQKISKKNDGKNALVKVPNKINSKPKQDEKDRSSNTEKQDTVVEKPSKEQKEKKYVTISIHVDTILDNYDKLDKPLQSEKFVPKNGVILKTTKYEIKDNDNVFDVLLRATRDHYIQMEYQGANDNSYGSVYIEGINHIYEFSVGDLSGWMYSVNGHYPNYGASKYILKDGDKIEWNYTCDLGRDLGVNPND